MVEVACTLCIGYLSLGNLWCLEGKNSAKNTDKSKKIHTHSAHLQQNGLRKARNKKQNLLHSKVALLRSNLICFDEKSSPYAISVAHKNDCYAMILLPWDNVTTWV